MIKFEKSHDDQAWAIFAAAALQGLIARGGNQFATAATQAAGYADAMLEEFRKRIPSHG